MSARLRWSIVGCGVAGRARARALGERQDVVLVGVHRGRFAGESGAPVLDADDAIAAADVVSISAPSETHPDWVRRVLAAGRHVVVDYPLAPTAREAAALFRQAAAADRLLHVEHIELLSPGTRWMVASGWDRAGAMAMSFTTPTPAADGAALAVAQLARLNRLVAVGGRVAAIETRWLHPEGLSATVHFAGGGTAALEVRVGPRRLNWTVPSPGGALSLDGEVASRGGAPVALPRGALFAEDTAVAVARLRGEAVPYADDATVLHGIACAEALAKEGWTPVMELDG